MANNQALKAFDNREKAVLKDLENYYAEMLEELTAKVAQMNAQAISLIIGSDDKSKAQAQSKVYQYEYQKRMKEQISAILDKLRANEYETIEQFLQDSYTNGYVGTLHEFAEQGVPVIAPIDQEAVVRAIQTDSKLSETLYDTLGQDLTKLKTQVRQEITRGIATNLTTNDIARNLRNVSGISLGRAKTIARTESHRIRETASFDAGMKAKEKGADLVKEWVATRDTRVRDTHRRLDGQFRELEEEFEIDGKKALYPGAFGRPEEDCNCHCHTNKVARWLLGEEELQRMHERAAIWGLEDDDGKVAQYKEYEKKFLEIPKDIEDSAKSGIIEPDKPLSELFKNISGDLEIRAKQVDSILYTFTNKKSLWSGETKIVERKRMPGVAGKMEWDKSITLRSDSSIKTAIHELLHTRSVLHDGKNIYLIWKPLEEGSVEMFAEAIAKSSGLSFRPSYEYEVNGLNIIRSITRYGDEFTFAKDLFEVPLQERYDWISNLISKASTENDLSDKSIAKLQEQLEIFKKKV